MIQVLNYQVLAEFLKYAGLIVGTASSVWGAVNELKEEGPNGRKQLTRAGKTSIAITVVSLIVSLTSAAVGDNLAREADKRVEEKRQADTVAGLQRHQEVIARQQEVISRQLEALALSEKTREEQHQRFDRLTRQELEALALSEKTREEQHQRFDRLTRQEARSTNEILTAGQSLRAISLSWSFPHGESMAGALFDQYDSDVDDLDKEWGWLC